MRIQRIAGAALAALLSFATGCSAPPAQTAESQIDTVGGRLVDEVGRPLPDTTAVSVWRYLDRADYAEHWAYWPGLGELYGGAEPHGLLLTTYLNSAAHEAAAARVSEMPEGAIIVKEAYLPDRTLDALTVMYKAPGYDPEHSNWFFAEFQPDGGVEAAGRVERCQDCHEEGPDYIRTAGFGSADD